MFVEHGRVSAAARRVDAIVGEVPAGALRSAVDQGVDAVPGSQTARALDEVGGTLLSDLNAFSEACQEWALTVQTCLAEYADRDALAAARADRLGWSFT